MDRGGFLQRLRKAGLSLALFALVFKAMLPPGHMLSTDAGERIVMTLCGGGEAVLDLSGSTDHNSGHGNAAAQCPFAFTSAPVLSALELAAPVPRQWPAGVQLVARIAWNSVQPWSGPPLPARGPPLHA